MVVSVEWRYFCFHRIYGTHTRTFSHSFVKSAGFDNDTTQRTSNESDETDPLAAVESGLSLLFWISLLVITIRSRMYIRQKFQIPGNCIEGKKNKGVDLCRLDL